MRRTNKWPAKALNLVVALAMVISSFKVGKHRDIFTFLRCFAVTRRSISLKIE